MKTITSKIKLIGGMLSFMIAAIVGITVYINHVSKQDSVVINIAGKQRMLSQKITKEVLWLQNHYSDEEVAVMNISMTEFESSLHDLINGNDARGIYAPPKACIKERLYQVYSLWESFKTHLVAFQLLQQETWLAKAELFPENDAILEISDHVVKQMVADGLGGIYIDNAGRQRMLTQQMAFYATQYLITGELKNFTQFYNAYNLYGATLASFVSDASLQNHSELTDLLDTNDKGWAHYSGFIIDLMEKQKRINEHISRIKELNLVLLDMMDSAVSAYANYSEDQREFLQYFQYAASLIAVLAMFLSVKMTRRIEDDFGDFLRQSEAMASTISTESEGETAARQQMHQGDELTMASMHMNQFMSKMNMVLQHAQQAISESEKAARELADVSENMDSELQGLGIDEAAKKDIDRTIDRSEDIVIQTLEELSGTSKLLTQLQNNLNTIISKTSQKPHS